MYIGKFCELTNTTPKTIRYYESIGLLPESQRSGKYRMYDSTYVETVRQIKIAQQLGFKLSEIKGWCEGANIQRGLPRQVLLEALTAKKQQLSAEIKKLQAMNREIDALAEMLEARPCQA